MHIQMTPAIPEMGTETFGLLDDRRQQGKSTPFDFQ